MMNNHKSQSMHNNWYQNAASLPRSAVNAPIQFQQFDGDDEIQQQQQQPVTLMNSDQHQQMQQAQQFFVTSVPDGYIPIHLNGGIGGGQLSQGVPEFAFANIPTNIAFNFGENFAMQSMSNQPSFGPPTSFPMNMNPMNMNPMNPNHFVGFNEQFPSTNTADINDINDINDIQQDIIDINQNNQDIEECARINNNDNVDDNNNDEQEQDQVDMNMMNNFNDNDTNDNDNDNHHFVAQDIIHNSIEQDGDLLPPAINEEPMRAQYSHCSEASNTTNSTHLSHDSHAAINVNHNYNQRATRRRIQRQRQRQRQRLRQRQRISIPGDFKHYPHPIGRIRRSMFMNNMVDPNHNLLSQRPRYRVAVDYPTTDVDDKHIIHRSINNHPQQYYQSQSQYHRYPGHQLPPSIVDGQIPPFYDDEMESQNSNNSNTSFSNTTASPSMSGSRSGNNSVKTSPSFDADNRVKAESPESMLLGHGHNPYANITANYGHHNNTPYGLSHEPKLVSRTATIIEHVVDDIHQIATSPYTKQAMKSTKAAAIDKKKNNKNKNKNNAKPFECPSCGNRYKYKSSMKLHFKVHTSEAKICKECGKRFPHEHKLKIHMRSHTGERPYKCDICPKAFSDKSNLNRHKRLHTGEKPYECEFCHRRYSDSSALVDHRRRKHTLEKPYKCQFCAKTFAASSDLTSHLAVHSNIRPFECTQCKKRFKRRSDVHKHMKTHQVKVDKRRRRNNGNGQEL